MSKKLPLFAFLAFFNWGALEVGLATAAAAPKTSGANEKNYISLDLPPRIYKSLNFSATAQNPTTPTNKSEETQIEFSLAKIKPLGGATFDAGWLCLNSIEDCAKFSGTQNYWIDGTSNEIRVGSQTESIQKRRIGKWMAIEAFPLCGWTSRSTGFNPAGGQCYSVVLSGEEKTISFNILLGQNKGCRNIEICWKSQLIQLRQMLSSAN